MTLIGSGGKLSGGKTITGMYLMDHFGLAKKKKIISNIQLNLDDYELITNDELIMFIKQNINDQKALMEKFYNSFMILDEIRGLISARKNINSR